MVKRSRVYCSSIGGGSGKSGGSGRSGGIRRSVAFALGVLVLYTVLSCGSGAVTGTSSLEDLYAAAAATANGAAGRTVGGAGRYRADDSAAAGAVARNGRSATNLSHITGTARKIKMFIKNRYLQVFPDGTVNGTAEDTSDYVILQRTSVNMGQLKIQGVATCMYFCMDACGLLYGSKDFEEECVFNEMIEQHHYNTYTSARYTNDKRTLYMALNKRGTPRKVQLKANASLGKLSTYTRVLTQPVPAQRVEQLLAARRLEADEWPASVPHGHRHHHACPPHVGPPHATAKHRKSGRKCQGKGGGGGGGRKKNREDANKDGGGGSVGGKEDEDCGGNKKGGRCGGGDEISHRKVDAAGRKKKSKKPTVVGGKGEKRQQGKAKRVDAPPPPLEPVVVVQTVTTVVAPAQLNDEDDDDDDATSAATAPTDEFLDFNDN